MKRPLILIAFIIGVVFLSIDLVIELTTISALFDILSILGELDDTFVALVTLLALACVILIAVALIFNAICISKWNKSKEDFAMSKGMLNGTIILNFVIVGIIVLLGIVNKYIDAMGIVLILALVATNVLALVELNSEKKD